jgi:RNA-directed DNA polymerase
MNNSNISLPICNVIEPIFDATFIYDSYACRVVKGQHAALRRLREFLRHNRYVLKGNVVRFFPSIDHEILLKLLARKIGDEKLLHLLTVIIAHSPPETDEPVWFPDDGPDVKRS